MGIYSTYINKALLPINKKAVISHIINQFPIDTEFIIALGDKGDQVQHYLTIAHPELAVQFISVDNYDGQGSGPGYSLLCCKEKLERPFFFVSCDTLWNGDVLNTSFNWLGVSKVPEEQSDWFCNVESDLEHQRVIAFHDKVKVYGERFSAFSGLCFIKDYEIFWDGLNEKQLISGEHQISNGLNRLARLSTLKTIMIDWDDVGNLEKYREIMEQYEAYDFSKTNEFLYIINQQVIKFFADNNVSRKRVKKAKLNSHVFPIIKHNAPQFYSYDFLPGKTLYEYNNVKIFNKLLNWLDTKMWKEHPCSPKEMRSLCEHFYRKKTMERLKRFKEKYSSTNKQLTINGSQVPSIDALIKLVP